MSNRKVSRYRPFTVIDHCTLLSPVITHEAEPLAEHAEELEKERGI
ncbi:MAG: hypothetical protein OXD01_16010 [Gammaproteobacteria bacterium]|nr:hypothetical protein [Gammaproteobacteria bacterium]